MTGAQSPAWRLSALYAALFFELGINLPFFPVWLRAQSLSDAAIGIAIAVPFYVRLLANPAVSALADRHGRIDAALVTCAVVVAAASGMLLVADGTVAIILVITVIAFAQGPLIALTDTLTLSHLARLPGHLGRYGGIRLWGSIAFAFANLAAGVHLEWLPADAIVYFLIGAATAVAMAAVRVARRPSPPPLPPAPRSPARFHALRHKRILLVIGGAALIQASHGLLYSFSTLHWQTIGLSSTAIGGLWAIGVAAEIAFFAVLGRLIAAGTAPMTILAVGGVAATVRWLAMAADPPGFMLLPLQMSHALSFGATHAGSVFLLVQLAPPAQRAQVQGWLAALWAGLMAGFISLSGYLMPSWGQSAYLLMAAAAASGLGLVALAIIAGPDRAFSPGPARGRLAPGTAPRAAVGGRDAAD